MEKNDVKYFIKRSRVKNEKDITKIDLELVIYNLMKDKNEYGGIKLISKEEDLYMDIAIVDKPNYVVPRESSLEVKISKRVKGEVSGTLYIGILNVEANRYDLVRVN